MVKLKKKVSKKGVKKGKKNAFASTQRHIHLGRKHTTKLFDATFSAILDKTIKIIVSRGGTRSSKTISNIQCIAVLTSRGANYGWRNKDVLITTDTLPNLKGGALKDFKDICKYDEQTGFGFGLGLGKGPQCEYIENKLDKTIVHKATNNTIHYRGYTDSDDALGQKFDLIYINEANRVSYDVFRQLAMRLKAGGTIILDFNPDDENIWINTEIEQRRSRDKGDVAVFQSSYKDNHFLSEDQVDEIEYLKSTDAVYWQIYGKGEYGTRSGNIFTNWSIIPDFRTEVDVFYGMDVGFGTTTLIKCGILNPGKRNQAHVLQQMYYGPMKSSSHILKEMETLGISKTDLIYCDTNTYRQDNGREKLVIADKLSDYGYNSRQAKKGKGSVFAGIDLMRSGPLYIVAGSTMLEKETKIYKWKKDSNGNDLEIPVKYFDHGLDGGRMGLYSYYMDFIEGNPMVESGGAQVVRKIIRKKRMR